LHDPLADRKPPGGEQADIDKAAQIGKQHRAETAPAHNSEAICQYHGKYSDAACYDSILFLLGHKQTSFRLYLQFDILTQYKVYHKISVFSTAPCNAFDTGDFDSLQEGQYRKFVYTD
jgi:hypothetical protein